MKIITKQELITKLVDHPYDTNPSLVAKVNFFYYSEDKRMAMAYYESPVGWFDVTVEGFEEIDYVIEGEVELRSATETISARAGDCFHIKDGDNFRWTMIKPSKMIFFIYPLTKDINELIKKAGMCPEVDEKGRSECPIALAEELYAKKMEKEEKVDSKLDELMLYIELIDKEIEKIYRNLSRIRSDASKLHYKQAKEKYDNVIRAQEFQLEKLRQQRTAILDLISKAKESLDFARDRFPYLACLFCQLQFFP